MRRTALFLLAAFLLGAVPGHAQWKTLKTPAFVLFYPAAREQQALEVLAVLEATGGYVEKTLGGRARRVAVVLTDVGIESNGLTDPVFRRILLYPYSPSPQSAASLASLQSWWRLLWIHEYAHWVHLDMASGVPMVLKALLGNVAAPNLFAPAWLHEGISVYAESGFSPGEGRLNDGSFAAYVTALAREDALPSIAAATFQDSDFPGGTGPYLYGGVFLGYLVETYGEEALREFLRGTSSSLLSYLSPFLPAVGLDCSARRAFGKSLRKLWQQWGEEERLQASRVQAGGPEDPSVRLGADPGWLEEPVAWGGQLFYRRSRPLDTRPLETRWVHELVRLDPDGGGEEVLVRSPGPFTGPLVVRDGTLYYALLELGRGFANTELAGYGFEAQVLGLDLQSREHLPLLRAPLRTFAVLADGDLLCSLDRQEHFGSEIALFRRTTGALERLFETEYLVAEIANGPEGVFVSARRDGESFGVYRVSGLSGFGPADALDPGALRLEPVLGSGSTEGWLSLGGGRLYFAANPGGQHRIYGLELSSGRRGVSATLDYQSAPAFDPASGRLYGLGLEPGGYTLYEVADPLAASPSAAWTPATGPTTGPPPAPWAPPPVPEERVRRGGYLDNLATLLPKAVLPVLFAFNTATWDVQLGATLLGMSALGDLSYDLSVFYDSFSGRAELEAALQVRPALPLQAELYFSTHGTTSLGLTVVSPLVRRLSSGLSYLSLGAGARLFDAGFSRFELTPLLGVGLRGPFTRLGVQLSLPGESRVLGSQQDALALLGGLELSQLLGPVQLGFEAVGVSSFVGPAWRLPAPPAYAEGLPALLGAEGRLELCVPVLRVRWGLWNPAVYLEDVYLAAFTEAALNESLALQLSAGGELHLELRALAAATGVPVDLFLRVAVSREGELGVSFGVESYGLEDYIRSHRREVIKQ
ncbi:MAG: hypothetical protein JW820_12180 [Spirochaetales bacterium]|nr:hypothetical protein [Spirochaetales bacterium]